MTELIQVLTAISLYCGPHNPMYFAYQLPGKMFTETRTIDCAKGKWKCIDKVRAKKTKRKCWPDEGDGPTSLTAKSLVLVCDSFDEDKEMEKCFR